MRCGWFKKNLIKRYCVFHRLCEPGLEIDQEQMRPGKQPGPQPKSCSRAHLVRIMSSLDDEEALLFLKSLGCVLSSFPMLLPPESPHRGVCCCRPPAGDALCPVSFGPIAKDCHGCTGQLSFTIVWVPAARRLTEGVFSLPQKASRGKEIKSSLHWKMGAETEQPSSNDSGNNNGNYRRKAILWVQILYWCWQAMSAERSGALALVHVWSLSSRVWLHPWIL